MKSLKQVVLPIALVIGLVFGVTYMSNWTPSGRDKDLIPDGEQLAVPVIFAITSARPDPDVKLLRHYRSDYEVGQPGQFDFWFKNPNAREATLVLSLTNCTCTGVEVGTLDRDAWGEYLERSAALAFPRAVLPPGADLLGAASLAALLAPPENIHLTTLETEPTERDDQNTSAKVPPADDTLGPQLGFLRLAWNQTKNLGPITLNAEVLMHLPEEPERVVRFDVNIFGVPQLRTVPNELDFGTLTEGQERSLPLLCFSTTRTEVELRKYLSAELVKEHPCIEVGEITPMTDEEMQALSHLLSAQPGGFHTAILSGFQVKVTIAESRNGKQMDLGPIDKHLQLRYGTEPDQVVRVPLTGTVRGEVRVRGGSGDVIDLGSFQSRNGTSREVRLTAARSGLSLAVVDEETFPKFLKVELEPVPDEPNNWVLRVEVPPKNAYGTLVSGSGVSVEITDSEGVRRHIRIPIKGSAYGL